MSGTYLTADAAFAVPDGFIDRTINVLEWSVEDTGDKLSLIAQREKLPQATSLDAYVAKQTKNYAIEFEAYRVEQEVATESSHAEATHMAFRFKREREVLYTHQVFVLAEGHVLIFTASAKAIHRGRVDELIDGIMASLELRERS